MLMTDIEEILHISSDAEFERAAVGLFRFQAERCAPYREYVRLVGIDPAGVDCVARIPFLPIELFKTHDVYCGEKPPQALQTPEG